MANTHVTHILLPNENSWDIWAIQKDQPATLHTSYPVQNASEIDKAQFPSGDLVFLFPVIALTALPIQVHTGDSALFPDLASIHAENAGLRPNPLEGQLADVFPVKIGEHTSTLLSIILKSLQPETLPAKSPKTFDISARAFPIEKSVLTIWRELGQWVFAIHHEGKLLYCQATASKENAPDKNLSREIRIAMAQISMQGIELPRLEAIIWSASSGINTSEFEKSLALKTSIAERPTPVLPSPHSKLLPADVLATRDIERRRKKILTGAVVLISLYLGAICYLAFGVWQAHSQIQEISKRVNETSPESDKYRTHLSKWDELEHVLNINHNTVEILHRVSKSMPINSGLRLKSAEITATEIQLTGEAPQPEAINQFSLNLRNRNNNLSDYQWQTPEANQSGNGWKFTFTTTAP